MKKKITMKDEHNLKLPLGENITFGNFKLYQEFTKCFFSDVANCDTIAHCWFNVEIYKCKYTNSMMERIKFLQETQDKLKQMDINSFAPLQQQMNDDETNTKKRKRRDDTIIINSGEKVCAKCKLKRSEMEFWSEKSRKVHEKDPLFLFTPTYCKNCRACRDEIASKKGKKKKIINI